MGFGEDAIREGLARAVLPCRTQYIPGAPDMLLDGAHNGPAVAALCRTLDRYFADRNKVLLFACMKDKDYKDMAAQLAQRFDRVFVTNVDPVRGAPAGKLAELFGLHIACSIEDDPQLACEAAAAAARIAGGLLVVCGSFYLAGLVLRLAGKPPG